VSELGQPDPAELRAFLSNFLRFVVVGGQQLSRPLLFRLMAIPASRQGAQPVPSNHRKLGPNETSLVGWWIMVAGRPEKDDVCLRIEWLTSEYLRQVAISKRYGAWETLYRDPEDSRFWERTYPQGEMHGGGPPALTVIADTDAMAKYEIASDAR
jgi:hypothetical protein